MSLNLPILTNSWFATLQRWRAQLTQGDITLAKDLEAVGIYWCGTSSGSANEYELVNPSDISLLTDGIRIAFKAHQANTGAFKVKFAGQPFVSVTRPNAVACAANDVLSGHFIICQYDESADSLILIGTSASILFSVITALGNGMLAKTGTSTYAVRTITGTTDVITVTNGDGVSGNPTLDIDQDYKDGWVPAGETWTYASTSTFTASGDLTTKYQKGDKLRLKQGGGYIYLYLRLVSHAAGTTTFTVLNSGTTPLGNAAITDNYYSHIRNPVGFPGHGFTFTSSPTGFSGTPTSSTFYMLEGRLCTAFYSISGTSNLTTFTASLPIQEGIGMEYRYHGVGTDNSVYANLVLAQISASGSSVSFFPQGGSANWTNANTKQAVVTVHYYI